MTDSNTSIGTDLIDPAFAGMSLAEVCALASHLQTQVRHTEALNAKLSHEMAVLKRLKFAATSERFSAEQKSLLEEAIDEDLEALAREVENLQTTAKKPVDKPLNVSPCHQIFQGAMFTTSPRTPPYPGLRLPAQAYRRRHLGEARLPAGQLRGRAACAGQVGLRQMPDAYPGAGAGRRHRQGHRHCRLDGAYGRVQVHRPPTAVPPGGHHGSLRRVGPRSTQAEWVGAIGVQLAPLVQAMREDLLSRHVLHADETPVAMLKPGLGKTHRAYLWSYCTTVWDDINAVVFDFAESRAGHNARRFLGIGEDGVGGWRGTLICDDYAGYKQAMNAGVTEAGCLAHARRKFHELWANHSSTLAEQALKLFGVLYDIEREVKGLDEQERLRVR